MIIMNRVFKIDTTAYDAGYNDWTNYNPEIGVGDVNPYEEFNSKLSWQLGWDKALEDNLEEYDYEQGNAVPFVIRFDCNDILPF